MGSELELGLEAVSGLGLESFVLSLLLLLLVLLSCSGIESVFGDGGVSWFEAGSSCCMEGISAKFAGSTCCVVSVSAVSNIEGDDGSGESIVMVFETEG